MLLFVEERLRSPLLEDLRVLVAVRPCRVHGQCNRRLFQTPFNGLEFVLLCTYANAVAVLPGLRPGPSRAPPCGIGVAASVSMDWD